VAPRTQLDPLIGILESREEGLVRAHAEAVLAIAAARMAEEDGRARLAAELPCGRTAAEWRESEQRADRLRRELLLLGEKRQQCERQEEATRAALEAAHRRLETMRRAAERIRAGILQLRDRAEAKEIDEAALRRFRKVR
jgi:flagellar biosynthesis chaperone FliJ